MIGQSAAHKALLEEIRLVANSDLSVLITGETGVGKELVAQSIHRHSMRSGKPMISLNCAALPETLVESELFGHVRGAFSGAVNERRGKFELADGGSLFLDEVGELPLAVQAKLLRVLQSGQLQRVGSDREHRVDVRLIAATNRDLAEEVRAGRFRADLYHRLSVYPLRVPLRARPRYPPAGRLLPRGKPTAPGTAQPAPGPRGPGRAPRLSLAGQRARTRAPGRPRLAQGPRPQSGAIADRHPASAGSRPARGTPAPPRSVVEPAPSVPQTGHSLRAATDAYQRRLIQDCLARHQEAGPRLHANWAWIAPTWRAWRAACNSGERPPGRSAPARRANLLPWRPHSGCPITPIQSALQWNSSKNSPSNPPIACPRPRRPQMRAPARPLVPCRHPHRRRGRSAYRLDPRLRGNQGDLQADLRATRPQLSERYSRPGKPHQRKPLPLDLATTQAAVAGTLQGPRPRNLHQRLRISGRLIRPTLPGASPSALKRASTQRARSAVSPMGCTKHYPHGHKGFIFFRETSGKLSPQSVSQ